MGERSVAGGAQPVRVALSHRAHDRANRPRADLAPATGASSPRPLSVDDPVSGLPNFFIAGAPKSGSTSLYHYLDQHPRIYLSPVKEPTFFGKEDLLSGWWRERTLRQIEKERPVLRSYLDGPMSEEKWLLVLDHNDYLRLF